MPVLWFSKALGHGGDLFRRRGGDFTKINLAWLNWWLKDDQTATGKGLLVGAELPVLQQRRLGIQVDEHSLAVVSGGARDSVTNTTALRQRRYREFR